MNFEEMCVDVDWIGLTQDSVQ